MTKIIGKTTSPNIPFFISMVDLEVKVKLKLRVKGENIEGGFCIYPALFSNFFQKKKTKGSLQMFVELDLSSEGHQKKISQK